jgi:hypothetical protein
VSRVVATAVLCAAFAVLIGGNASRSAQTVLVHEATAILPEDTRILDSDYSNRCLGALNIPSPPCLSVRFRLPGTADERAGSLLARAKDGWRSTTGRNADTGHMQFRHGRGTHQVRAYAYILDAADVRRCHEPVLVKATCDDYLRVELGRPTPPLKVEVPAVYGTIIESALRRRNAQHQVLVQTTGG